MKRLLVPLVLAFIVAACGGGTDHVPSAVRRNPFDDCYIGAGLQNCGLVHPDIDLVCKDPGPSAPDAECKQFVAVRATSSETASNTLTGYVATAPNGAYFVRWLETKGGTSGTLYWTGLNPQSQGGIQSGNSDFTLARSGNQLTLTFPQGFGASSTLSGLLSGSTLTLYIPTENGTIAPVPLRQGSLAEYNDAVVALQQWVGRETAQAAAAQTEAAVAAQATAMTQFARDAQQGAATRQRTCAAINGHVDDKWGWCTSNVQGNASGDYGLECSQAHVEFNSDGSISRDDLENTNLFYPGCFPTAASVPEDVAPCSMSIFSSRSCSGSGRATP